jgi:hypothetical protein
MAFAGEIGWIGKSCPDHSGVVLEAKVMKSAAGYYIGTQCPECQKEDPSPFSRESHYYETKEDLLRAFESPQGIRWRDTDFHPGPLEIEWL